MLPISPRFEHQVKFAGDGVDGTATDTEAGWVATINIEQVSYARIGVQRHAVANDLAECRIELKAIRLSPVPLILLPVGRMKLTRGVKAGMVALSYQICGR